jgi:hypothetical protein
MNQTKISKLKGKLRDFIIGKYLEIKAKIYKLYAYITIMETMNL